ncbi:MAG: C-terminal target protein [Flaviaesturariibacter sp.]|nr:C-terminal target protein [Flaviaesturariibacter sp.]
MKQILSILAIMVCATGLQAQQTTSMGFLTFNAKVSYPQVNITWETLQELTVDHFDVERSADGVTYTTVATFQAKGDTSSAHWNKYSFTDRNAATVSARIFYRLRSLDIHGNPYYSKVVSIQFRDKKLMVLASNNVRSNLWLTISSSRAEQTMFLITDQKGIVVSRQKIYCEKGIERKSIDVSNLPLGLYTVSVAGGGMDMVDRFVKN